MLSIAVDFDGTLVDHCYPDIGEPVPGAFHWLKAFQDAGAVLFLWTMRSGDRADGSDPLAAAVEFCREQGIEFHGMNENSGQRSWTTSPKLYANAYIDDAAIGCPLLPNPREGGRPFVDWSVVGPIVMELIEANR